MEFSAERRCGLKELLLTCFCESSPDRSVAAKPNDRAGNSSPLLFSLFDFSVTALLLILLFY